MRMLYFLLLIFVPLVNCGRIVNTNSGPIEGTTVSSKKVEAFLGIPYAEPPVGPLRFARTVPKSPWKETLEATQMPPACIQGVIEKIHFPMKKKEISEDCLFLNIWVPEGGSDDKTIMLFIHGGAYMVGSSNWELYDGSTLSEHGDVIVATINYRVGTLGFFSGLIDEAGGNMGMYDQVTAIQWIKDNAKHFGGDPENILLFGESAGSFSVSLHMVSPLSKNLFKRGILQSGSAIHPMYSEGNELLLMGSQIIASMLGCAGDKDELLKNPKAVVDCMKSLPAEKISEADTHYFTKVGWLIPRVGDEFLPEKPVDLYRKGEFKDDEVLIGTTKDEGSLFVAFRAPEIFGLYGENINPETFGEAQAKEVLNDMLKIGDNKVINDIVQTYFDRIKDSSRYSYLQATSEAVGDFTISCGAVFQAEIQSLKKTPVYFYVFDYRPHSTTLAEWIGVAHFEEVQYVFGNPMYDSFTGFEKEFSKDVMDMWVAFAKTGNPNIAGGVKWPQYSVEDPEYYIIGRTDGVELKPDKGRCEAWRQVFRAEIDH